MNLHSHRFHAVHGRNVAVSDDGFEAWNAAEDVLGPGVAFSNRPLVNDETVCLRLKTPYWPLAELTFGFTWFDPTSLLDAVRSRTWRPVLLDVRLEKPNLYINVNSSGELHFWGEDAEYTRCVTGVDTSVPLWLVLQLPSMSASVQFIEAKKVEQPPCGYIHNLLPFYFHDVHGRNIKILGQEVYCKRRTRKTRNGAVFTSRPVRVNERVCLRIHGVDKETDIQIGFTNQDPETWANRPSKVIYKKLINRFGYRVKLLENSLYRKASNIFFYVNTSSQLGFGVDGQTLGHIPIGIDTSCPLWALVVISGKDVNLGFANAEFMPRAHVYSHLVNDSLQSLTAEEISPATEEFSPTQISDEATAQVTSSGASECFICNENQANAVLLPCSHMCSCYECALKLYGNESTRLCPICRIEIVKILRIYPC